eukprot:6193491-Pleurochrysis_carterae.AAC.1
MESTIAIRLMESDVNNVYVFKQRFSIQHMSQSTTLALHCWQPTAACASSSAVQLHAGKGRSSDEPGLYIMRSLRKPNRSSISADDPFRWRGRRAWARNSA